MATIIYGTTKNNILTAKIRVSVKQNDNYKIVTKYTRNEDGLTEAKFKKLAEKTSYDFEQEVKLKEKSNRLEIHTRVSTFPELAEEFIDNIKQNLSISYLERAIGTTKLFNNYLKEKGLYYKPISDITVRDVQTFLNSFKTYQHTNGNIATLKKQLPKSVNFREMARQKIVSRNCSYYMKKGFGLKYEKALAICEFNHLDFDTYFIYKAAERTYSEETIKGHRRLLRTIFNEAVRYEWIDKNPVCATKVGSQKGNSSLKPVKEKEVFSLAETQAFISALDKDMDDGNINKRVPIKLMLLTGVRIGELNGLRWEDVDMENLIVHVRRNRLYAPGIGVYEKSPKTRTSTRDIPLPPEIIPDLERYKDWFRLADRHFDNKLDKYYLVSNGMREPSNVESISTYLSRFEATRGFKHISPHGLRHTYCSLLLSQNVPIQTVSKYMGHADSAITLEVYSHFIPDTKQKVINALSFVINNKKDGE